MAGRPRTTPAAAATAVRTAQIADIIRPAVQAASADPTTQLPNTPAATEQNVQAIAASAANHPETVNTLGVEPWWQSGVLWGLVSTLVLAGFAWVQALIPMLPFEVRTFKAPIMVPLTTALGTNVWAVYRRVWPNLQPLFWQKGAWHAWAALTAIIVIVGAFVVIL